MKHAFLINVSLCLTLILQAQLSKRLSVVDYTFTDGTASSGNIKFPANAIPVNAFWNEPVSQGKINLISVNPSFSVISPGELAFSGCQGLTFFVIPPSVTSMGVQSILWFTNSSNGEIPASAVTIANYAFLWSCGLITANESNQLFRIRWCII
jgi:hypothetical protein